MQLLQEKEEEPSGFQAHKRNNMKRLKYETNIILSNKMWKFFNTLGASWNTNEAEQDYAEH